MADETTQDTTQDEVQEAEGGAPDTFSREQLDELVKERLAEVKAEQDKAFANLWEEGKQAKARAKELEAKLAELQQQKQAEKAGLTTEHLEKLRADVRKTLEQEYAPVVEEKKTLAEQLAEATDKVRSLQLDSRVKAQMGQLGVRSDRIDTLFRLERDRFGLTDDGQPMLKEEPTADIGKYISERLRSEYPEWFNGSGASGSGAPRSGVGDAGKPVISMSDGDAFLRNVDKIAKGEVDVRL